ncbi:hypothetical protein EZV62_000475 [Acer yangbiense]|uniref:PGG domain-containing protein n=1 Tax=Acer yangbiense TaxID=1000413 RepID=A0A5C7IU26_9ROSI|nr:hypothetical protein EZV62_000475 [Acer yangbiense]
MAASTTLVSSSVQTDTIVVNLGAAADPHDMVLIAESIDAHSTQAQQNHIYGPTRLNLPDRSPLHSESENWNQYRLMKLHKAALKGNLEETKLLLGDNPQWMLRKGIAKRCQTVLHIATGTEKVSFVEEIIKMMKPDDLKLQDENGNTAFCIAAAD